MADLIQTAPFEGKILIVRGQRVILDADLASLYGVETRILNQAVKRNLDRFPEDFMFSLTAQEADLLRSQIVTSEKRPGKGGRRTTPYAFTEHGVLMAANLLRSPQALAVSIELVRAFVRLRSAVAAAGDLGKKIADIEAKLADHDEQFRAFHEIILPLLEATAPPSRRKIGFDPEK